MRIAFTSCSSNYICKDQPVWDEIRDARPNVLVLLGDSVYFDCSYGQHMGSLKEMSAQQFAEHVHLCYTKQLAQPEFARLLHNTTMPIHAIWDDHDCMRSLWLRASLHSFSYSSDAWAQLSPCRLSCHPRQPVAQLRPAGHRPFVRPRSAVPVG